MSKQTQTISFPELTTYILGVSDWVILAAASSAGLPMSYKVVSGDAIIEEQLLKPSKPGTVVLEISQAGDEQYDPAKIERTFEVVDGTVEQRMEKIMTLSRMIALDLAVLPQVNSKPLADMQQISFELSGSSVTLTIDGDRIVLSDKQVVMRFLNTSVTFWRMAMTDEVGRLAQLKTELKNKL